MRNSSISRGCAIALAVAGLYFLTVAKALAADNVAPPLSPAESIRAFQLADDQLMIELVAAEPDVVSPVAVSWDENGRMYVTEMSDYPTGPTSGKIKLLEGIDGGGKVRKTTLFADELAFPTGTQPWKGGVFVTAAPDILYLKSSEGKGKADERSVVLTGFHQGNQQLLVNGLQWGLDNWIYGANGRSDGEVRRPQDPEGQATSISRRDFRFRPNTGEVESIAGQSQFGMARDDWGNRFPSWNTNPIRHVVLEQNYLSRNSLAGGGQFGGRHDRRSRPSCSPHQPTDPDL
jgi:putative membrane-bound dehydrogenase-like protein